MDEKFYDKTKPLTEEELAELPLDNVVVTESEDSEDGKIQLLKN